MPQMPGKIWRDERGQDLVEYALLAGLVCVGAAVLPYAQLNTALRSIYTRLGEIFLRLCGV